jgi:hypothetical protein
MKITILQKILGWIIIAQSWLYLQVIWNKIMRFLSKEFLIKKARLIEFEDPWEMEKYLREHFTYRKDTIKIFKKLVKTDWVTHPKVVMRRLKERSITVGDCDDIHYLAAELLERITSSSAPTDVFTVSVVYGGGGHTFCIFLWKGRWYKYDYKISLIGEGENVILDVVKDIMLTYGKGKKMIFYTVQRTNFRVVYSNHRNPDINKVIRVKTFFNKTKAADVLLEKNE